MTIASDTRRLMKSYWEEHRSDATRVRSVVIATANASLHLCYAERRPPLRP